MSYASVNPSTGELVNEFAEISDGDLFGVLDRAHKCYESDWSRRSIADRAKVMFAVAAKLRENIDEYAGYATLEMGKLTAQSRAEVELSAKILDYYARNAEIFLKPTRIAEVEDAIVQTLPIGVILGIEPWNFPYYQVARVIAPQLMVGNVVIIKHAPGVPQTALALERLLESAGAPAGAYTNLFASNEQIARLIDDSRVRGVTITGSERAGSAVAERAGRALKKTVMELGGSDPFIVLEDAALETTLDAAILGRLVNAGQSCVAAKRFIVVGKDRGSEFLEGLIKRMKSVKIGDPKDPQTALGPVCSEPALLGLLDQISTAKASGAEVVLGGNRVDRPGFYLEPTIITGIDRQNPLFLQETFGPIVSFYVVENEEEAVDLANATAFGLGGSIYTADLNRGKRIANRIDSGMVFVNHPTYSLPELPFGGVKNSGFGRELSELGFAEFTNRKLINVFPAGTKPRRPVTA
ncbi:succinate-semialdehyde dehydrogenase / glutarate-semialdehyde dehydrogenase [Burkholderia sp. D7]|nr:succinate-semialdehyde dehydrogenase / glutarate-semialdehyde dehydrogenase [Burkholderia sp. D7]